MPFALELYAETTIQSISYSSVSILTHILFSDSLSQISLLNTLCLVMTFFHKNLETVTDVACVNACSSTQSEKSFCAITR